MFNLDGKQTSLKMLALDIYDSSNSAEPLRNQLPLSRHLWMWGLKHKDNMGDSLLELRPTHWCVPENIAWVRINDERCWALLDNGSMVNAVTPEFVEACFLDSSPLSDLVSSTLSVNGFCRLFTWPLGYVIIRAQVEGVWGYDEDQVALVIPDPTDFGSWVLVILGTPTINQIINAIKESKIDELSVSLNGSRISHLLACHWPELSIKSETAANHTRDLTDLSEAVKMTKTEEINAFSSKIIHAQMKTMFLGSNMHVMTQALEEGDSQLPHGFSVMNTYTKMATGSMWVVVLVKNLTTTPITITKGVKITWVIAANAIPQEGVSPLMLEKLNKMQGVQRAKMSVEQRKEALFK